MVGSIIVAGVSTGVGFLSLKKSQTHCQAKFLTSRHVCMNRVIFFISNTLRKLKI